MPDHGTAVLHAYRALYRQSLRAVQYSNLPRRMIRDHLRTAFRTSTPESFEPERIARTLLFLKNATTVSGLEHKILKNMVHIVWGRRRLLKAGEKP